MQFPGLPSNLIASLDAIDINMLRPTAPPLILVTLYHHRLFACLSRWDGPVSSVHHCISKNPPFLLLRDGSQMLAGWWLISWHLLWMGFSQQRRGQHFQRPEEFVASGTPIRDLLWDIHVHISGQSLWEPRPSKSRELMELTLGIPRKGTLQLS